MADEVEGNYYLSTWRLVDTFGVAKLDQDRIKIYLPMMQYYVEGNYYLSTWRLVDTFRVAKLDQDRIKTYLPMMQYTWRGIITYPLGDLSTDLGSPS